MGQRKTPNSFATRMMGYEHPSQGVLMRRTPVIVRVDGKAFSKFTRKFNKPFDQRIFRCMQAAALRLVKEAQNCRLAYFQSDEISLLLTDFRTLTTEAWFRNRVQKICSVSGALATAGFGQQLADEGDTVGLCPELPVFDARCFNLPREEVTNYFVWRQRDAERNSVSMLAQSHFSHKDKELQGLNRDQLMDMLMLKRGINWNDQDVHFKRGTCVTKQMFNVGTDSVRSKWVAEEETPIFSKDRDYVEKFLRDEEDRV